jgi:hypothetical protein
MRSTMRWAVDVSDLQGDHFTGTQPCTVGDRQRRAVLEVAGRLDQAAHLLTAQDHRQRLCHAHRADLGHQLGTTEGDLEEELQCGNRRVQRDRRDTSINAVQLITPQILGACRTRGAAEIARKVLYGTDVAALGLRRELAHPHVFDHALTQR